MAQDKRVALVTGGGSGIGAACAAKLAQQGYHVIVADLDETRAQRVANACGGEAEQFDVASETATEAFCDNLLARHGHLDALVSCAGVMQKPLSPSSLPMEDFDHVMAVDFRGVYLTCRAFGTRMAQHGSGAIVTISSCAAFRSTPLHAYGPAKAAVVALTQTLAAEWGRSGVRVNGVAPAYTLTEELQRRADSGERDLSRFGRELILGRPITPAEIAGPVAFLLSDAASAITGITLPVDGGLLAAGVWNDYGGLRESSAQR